MGDGDLRAELERRRKWFFETQLRRFNVQTWRGISRTSSDPDDIRLVHLISEPLPALGAGPLKVTVGENPLGPVYLDSKTQVWDDDERVRRDEFLSLAGDLGAWLEFREPQRLRAKIADLATAFERDKFASVLEPTPLSAFRRKAATLDPDPNQQPWDKTDGRGAAISRAVVGEAKPWLLAELYHPKHVDSSNPQQWLENLEQFLTDYESELQLVLGGAVDQRVTFDSAAPEKYREAIREALRKSTSVDPAAAVRAELLHQEQKRCGKPGEQAYKFQIKVATNGFDLGDPKDFPYSSMVKYWTRVLGNPLKEVYVNHPNSDMGLIHLVRTLYLFGTIPEHVASGDQLRWRKRTAPGPEFAEFFANRAAAQPFTKDPQLLSRLTDARQRLSIVMEESAAAPGSASVTFSPITQQVLRTAIHSYKFWLDEPLRAKDNGKLLQARNDIGLGGPDEMEYWSENHYIMFASSEFLAGQLWDTDEFQPGAIFLDPGKRDGVLTGKQRMERGKARALRWLNHRLMFGWTEFNSSGYYREHFWSLLNLIDFAQDREIREKATLAADLMMFDVARFLHKGGMGAAGGRSQFKSRNSGWDNALGDVIEILFGTRGLFSDSDSEIGAGIATSTYRVPDVLLEIATRPPVSGFTDRSRVSITFEESPKYGISTSQQSDQIDSLRDGYAPKLAKRFPFIDQTHKELARTHTGYGATEDSIAFWWSTSAFFNKQVVHGTLDCVQQFGLEQTGVFASLTSLIGTLSVLKRVGDGILGSAIGAVVGGGTVGAIAGGLIGAFSGDKTEDVVDDLSVFLEGSTRTRANIMTYRNRDVMLSSIQNFRVGQLNYQSNVNQATVNGAVNVFTTSDFAGLDISEELAGLISVLAGATATLVGEAILGITGIGAVAAVGLGIAAGVETFEKIEDTKHSNPFNPHNGDEDGPGWWTGYWSLPMVVQQGPAAIIAYDFHEMQTLLADCGSHLWFPKHGFDNADEVRCSGYDDADFFLLDIGDIGPKGFWVFGKYTHPADGVAAADRPEAYIGVFSNQRPAWLDSSEDSDPDFYHRQVDDAGKAKIGDLANQIDNECDPDRKKQLQQQKSDLERAWHKPLARDYFADQDWYVGGKNLWIVHVGNKDEYGDYQTFKDRVSSARVHLSDSGDMECTYHMPLPEGGSQTLQLHYGDGGEFHYGDAPLQTDLYPRFENPFLRSGRAEWGQRAYVIEYNGKTLLHDFSDFTEPVRTEQVPADNPDDVRALVAFVRTRDDDLDAKNRCVATVRIACATVTTDEIIAVGPVDDNTTHDAEWIFLDTSARYNPDMTIELTKEAFDDGDADDGWKMSFSLRALMGDYTLRDCTLSFDSVDFDGDRHGSGVFPVSIRTDRWRRWEPVPEGRADGRVVLAARPSWDKTYYDYCDLLVIGPKQVVRHRKLPACLTAAPQWADIPGGPGFTPSCSVAAASTVPGQLIAVVLDAGALFAASPDQNLRWTAWTAQQPMAGDLSAQTPVPLASPGTVSAGPSQFSGSGAELVVTGADGHVYAHFDWHPGEIFPWRQLAVSGFTLRQDGACVLVGNQLYVLDTDGAIWAAFIDRFPLIPLPPVWAKVSADLPPIRNLTAANETRLLAVSADGRIWDGSLPSDAQPTWTPLAAPADAPVPDGVGIACATPYSDHIDAFVVGANDTVYTAAWDKATAWTAWRPVTQEAQGFHAAPRTPLAVHRVNRQLELFVESTDGDLFRAWWS
ncbi:MULTISPECIES: PQQ-like beta-propeller repeat protein [unclassified Nocardia]|uniref:PQQ-like beta-propeller repeat protein n=1 Tax=unclassified Nocardia TaxID=2637762 RepID=UPI001CE40DDF|nr:MULTISPECIES: PQQ-like beta-propeller repeat protein [unclassified Nocardia]